MADVTRVLSDIEAGDPDAAEQLLPLVYEELRKLAAQPLINEKPGQTLQATALVHEAYIRLVDTEKAQHWNSRGHFFAAAAEAMRRILLNRARDKKCQKRGGQLRRIDLNKIEIATDTPGDDLIALDEALEQLAAESQECADLVKMRFFAAMSVEEVARLMGLSARTAKRHWTYARYTRYFRRGYRIQSSMETMLASTSSNRCRPRGQPTGLYHSLKVNEKLDDVENGEMAAPSAPL